MADRPDPTPGSNLPLPFQGGGGLPALRQAPPAYYPEEEEGLSLQHYLHVLLRRKWLLAAVAFTVVVLAALQVFTTTPMYRATARLQVDPEGDKIVPFQEVAGSEMAGGWFMENYMWTQTENLQSQSLALRVVKELDLANDPAFNASVHPGALVSLKNGLAKLVRAPFAIGKKKSSGESTPVEMDAAAAAKLAGAVSAQPVRNTRLIEVSYTSPDPELSARVVNVLT